MNDKIKEIVKQAGVFYSYQDDVWLATNGDFERFAELIILECGVPLSPMLRDMISRGQAFDLIKQHFGVEE